MVEINGAKVSMSNDLRVVTMEIAVAIKMLTILNKAENGIPFEDTLSGIVAEYDNVKIGTLKDKEEPSQMELLSYISDNMRASPKIKPHNLDDE